LKLKVAKFQLSVGTDETEWLRENGPLPIRFRNGAGH
jgi:hypothetical protein